MKDFNICQVQWQVASTSNPATLEAEFRSRVDSIPVGGNIPSISGWSTCFFLYKDNAYKQIQPGISEKNQHMLSILSSLENNSSLLLSCLKSHLEAFTKMFLRKLVNGFQPLNNFTKNVILDVWQGSDFASVIVSKVAGLQPSAYNFTKRWTPSHVFFKDFGHFTGTPV